VKKGTQMKKWWALLRGRKVGAVQGALGFLLVLGALASPAAATPPFPTPEIDPASFPLSASPPLLRALTTIGYFLGWRWITPVFLYPSQMTTALRLGRDSIARRIPPSSPHRPSLGHFTQCCCAGSCSDDPSRMAPRGSF